MSDIYFLKRKDVCTVSGNLQDDRFMKSIESSIIRKDIGLVIIDPLISYHGEDENNNRGMRQALQVITELCETFKVATILIHHDGKSASSSSKGGRGASSIGDWAPNIISLFHGKDKPSDIITVMHVKGRDFAPFDMFDLRRTDQFDFERHAGKVNEAENKKGVINAEDASPMRNEILRFLQQGEADQTTIVERIMQMFKKDEISRSKARKVLESMLAEGKVKSRKGGKSKLYSLKKSRKKSSQMKYSRLVRFHERRKSVA